MEKKIKMGIYGSNFSENVHSINKTLFLITVTQAHWLQWQLFPLTYNGKNSKLTSYCWSFAEMFLSLASTKVLFLITVAQALKLLWKLTFHWLKMKKNNKSKTLQQCTWPLQKYFVCCCNSLESQTHSLTRGCNHLLVLRTGTTTQCHSISSSLEI